MIFDVLLCLLDSSVFCDSGGSAWTATMPLLSHESSLRRPKVVPTPTLPADLVQSRPTKKILRTVGLNTGEQGDSIMETEEKSPKTPQASCRLRYCNVAKTFPA